MVISTPRDDLLAFRALLGDRSRPVIEFATQILVNLAQLEDGLIMRMRRFRLLLTTVIVAGLVAGFHAVSFFPVDYPQTHSVRTKYIFAKFFADQKQLVGGWYKPRGKCTWSRRKRKARLILPLEYMTSGDLMLIFELEPYLTPKRRIQSAKITVNGYYSKIFKFTGSKRILLLRKMKVNRKILDKSKTIVIDWKFDNVAVPKELGLSKRDKKDLGICLHAIDVVYL